MQKKLSDKAWLQSWRRNNRQALRAKYEHDDAESRVWDVLRFAIRTEYGDEQLDRVQLVAYQGTSKLD